jgi:CrcB protein
MRAVWTPVRIAAVAVGGSAGGALRWAVLASVESGRFPWPVLAVNVAGSFLLGVLLAEEWAHPRARVLLHDAGAIGFCGGLTTFSTFAVEVVDLARDDRTSLGIAYACFSVLGALAAVLAGAAALHRVRALRIPLEEEP